MLPAFLVTSDIMRPRYLAWLCSRHGSSKPDYFDAHTGLELLWKHMANDPFSHDHCRKSLKKTLYSNWLPLARVLRLALINILYLHCILHDKKMFHRIPFAWCTLKTQNSNVKQQYIFYSVRIHILLHYFTIDEPTYIRHDISKTTIAQFKSYNAFILVKHVHNFIFWSMLTMQDVLNIQITLFLLKAGNDYIKEAFKARRWNHL